MMDMVIAECPSCGARRYSWGQEDAVYKFSQHRCPATLLDKELNEILDRIIKKEDNKAHQNKESEQWK